MTVVAQTLPFTVLPVLTNRKWLLVARVVSIRVVTQPEAI